MRWNGIDRIYILSKYLRGTNCWLPFWLIQPSLCFSKAHWANKCLICCCLFSWRTELSEWIHSYHDWLKHYILLSWVKFSFIKSLFCFQYHLDIVLQDIQDFQKFFAFWNNTFKCSLVAAFLKAISLFLFFHLFKNVSL